MKFGVLVFPGSNCDEDACHLVGQVLHEPVARLWHESEDLEGSDVIVIPGGFAYGDYLRAGAIARFSPIMQAVREFAAHGGLVLGICNGFQILCESGLLPGALERNAGLKYICKPVHLRVETASCPFTRNLKESEVLNLPIGHMEGNYFCAPDVLKRLQAEDRVAFRYVTSSGERQPAANPNGSIDDIAGILNEGRNVLGMMPHPDRAGESILGSADGLRVFESLANRRLENQQSPAEAPVS